MIVEKARICDKCKKCLVYKDNKCCLCDKELCFDCSSFLGYHIAPTSILLCNDCRRVVAIATDDKNFFKEFDKAGEIANQIFEYIKLRLPAQGL